MKPKFRAKRPVNLPAGLISVVLATAGVSNATTFYWDQNGATGGYGVGTGTWAEDNTAPGPGRWTTSNNGTLAGSVTQTTGSGDSFNFGTATLGLSAGTITVSGTVNMGNTTYGAASEAIVLSGGTIAFSAAPTITVNNASNTISSIISGAATSFTKAGTGTLILNGANTFLGTTIVNSGTLDLGGGTATGSLDSTVLTLSGGAFSFTRTGTNTQSFATTNLNAAPASVISVAAGNTLNLGTVSRATGVTMDFSKVGAGTVAADVSSNDAAGIMAGFTVGDSWAVANGAGLAISGLVNGSYTLSSVAGTSGANYDGANIDIDDNAGALDAGIAANSLRFSTAAANSLSLTGSNTITSGGILVGSGVGANLSTITGGTLAGSAGKDLSVIQNNTSGGLTISSIIADNGGASSLVKSGEGLLTLSNSNTFTGGLIVNGGQVVLAHAGALNGTVNSENAVTFAAGSTGSLALGGNSVVIRSLNTNTASPGAAVVENASASAATLTIGNSGNAASTFAGVIRDGSGGGALSLIKAGTGNLTLSGINTFTGGTTLSGGQLSITSDDNLGASTGDVTFSGNATLRIDASTFVMDEGRTITVNNGVTATLSSNNSGKIFEGSLQGSGDLIAASTTSFSFTNAANTFSGDLSSRTGGATGYGLELASIGDGEGAGLINLGNSTTGGTLRWIKASGGTTTLVNRQIALSGTTGTGTIVALGGTSAENLIINRDLLISGTGNKKLLLGGSNMGANAFAGNISDGTGSVISVEKTEGGVWALGGTNTYSGITNLAASGTTGVLIFQGKQSLSPNTTIAFNQSSSNVQSVSFLDDGTGTVSFERPITFDGANTTQVMNIFVGNNNTANGGSSAGITTGSTIKVGAITWDDANQAANNKRTFNLTGANGYSMETGTFTLPNAVTRTAGTTFTSVMNPTTASLTVAGFEMSTGNQKQGIPILELGGTAAGNRVLGAINDAADVGAGATDAYALSLTKTGTGDWTLEGTNGYTGTTTVSQGSLIIKGSTSSTSIVSVASGATLGGDGHIGGAATVAGILSPGASPGTLTFGSDLTLANGATYMFEGGDLAAVAGALGLNATWTLELGSGLSDGGSVTIFSYGSLGADPNLAPTFNIDNLGFTPSGSLSLTDTGTSIVLNGLSYSAIPEPSTALLGALGLLAVFRRKR